MRRSGFAFPFAFALLSTAVIACGDGGMGDDDDDDDCTGVSNCSVQGSSCDGDTVVDCQPDLNGCLVETTVDCTASDEVCDDAGGEAMCVADSCDDVECQGASDGDSFCDGDTVVSCADDGNGCLVATTEDCTAGGDVCDDSADPAVCVPVCTDDPRCAGMNDGDTSCDGAFLNTCTADADGCLQLTQENCSPGLCDDSTPPAACGAVTETGDTCGDAIPVLSSTFVVSGADFAADFTDTETVTGTDCDGGNGDDVPDAVFTIDLMTDDELVISETGTMDAVINIQTTCGGAETCTESADAGEDDFRYTATQDETIFIVVEPFSTTDVNDDYSIAISLNPTCGNGLLEPGEICDDANTDTGDGCSDVCTPEFGYECDDLSPSTCQMYPSLGSYARGDVFTDLVVNDLLAEGESDLYTITFTTDVEIRGTLAPNNMGDPDIVFINDAGQLIAGAAVDGPEDFGPQFIAAGTYVVDINAFTELDMGYTLTLEFPLLGDGDTVSDTGGPLEADESDALLYTFSEDVEITGTLTSSDGDVDLYIFHPDGAPITSHTETGDETFNIALQAGSYAFVVNAFGAPASDYSLDFGAATLAVNDIGTFAPGETIADTVGGAITAPAFEHHTITFSSDVLLSGTLGGNSTGDMGIRIYNSQERFVSIADVGDDVFSDVALAAGTYIVQVRTFTAAGDVDAYTLSLSTTAPTP